jgi:GNAT superfamily N-acetyltransferase
MNPPKVIANANPPKEWFHIVGRGLERHNTAATGIVEYYPVCFVIREAGNHVRGGLYGNLWGQWLHVGSLWVDRDLRGRGLGIQLMAAAEEYARSKGCLASFLQTGSFEARPLYEKLGYRVYAALSDHPIKGHERFCMSKRYSEANLLRRSADVEITFEPYASEEVQEILHRGVRTHAIAAIGLPEEMWSAANFFLQNDDGEIVGGALGNIWGDWYFLDVLWVDRPHRGHDSGRRMLAAAEQHAIERGCTGAHLDTASFQARPFYEKLGYKVFGTLEDHPVGHSHYLLSKRLGAS